MVLHLGHLSFGAPVVPPDSFFFPIAISRIALINGLTIKLSRKNKMPLRFKDVARMPSKTHRMTQMNPPTMNARANSIEREEAQCAKVIAKGTARAFRLQSSPSSR